MDGWLYRMGENGLEKFSPHTHAQHVEGALCGAVARGVMLPADAWTEGEPCTQTAQAQGVKADSFLIAAPSPQGFLSWSACQVRVCSQAAGTLTFAAQKKPGEALTVQLLIVDA